MRTNEMASTPAITPKMNMYVGTAMTLNRVTPDCITVPFPPKIVRNSKLSKRTWKDVKKVAYWNVMSYRQNHLIHTISAIKIKWVLEHPSGIVEGWRPSWDYSRVALCSKGLLVHWEIILCGSSKYPYNPVEGHIWKFQGEGVLKFPMWKEKYERKGLNQKKTSMGRV